MRPQVPRLRCKYPRCTTATGRWIFAFLVICIAIAISWTLLLEDYKSVHRNDEYSIAAREVGLVDELGVIGPDAVETVDDVVDLEQPPVGGRLVVPRRRR